MTVSMTPTPVGDLDLPYLDIRSAEFLAEPHEVLRAIAAGGVPFAISSRALEVLSYPLVWSLLSHRAADTPGGHPAAQDAPSTERIDSFRRDGLLLDMEREQHDRIRRVVKPFTGGRIQQRRPTMTRIADRLIDEIADPDDCDVVAEFTHKYSIEVLCGLLGVPVHDIPTFESGTLDLRLMGSIPFEPTLPKVDTALQTLWD